jgi:hypothetical protein
MKKISSFGACAAAAVLMGTLAASASLGQEPEVAAEPTATAPGVDSWYYRSSPERETTLTIAQQKAVQRAAQRMARLDAMRWYGFSNSRPTASSIPWTTMYAPAWQTPGGRPFGWHVSHRPIVVIAPPISVYR